MSKARKLFFTAPQKIEIRESSLPIPVENEVLVASICSAISAGSELLVYRGQFPRLTDMHDALSSGLNYPLAYGYACVGKIIEIGKSVNSEWLGKLVFAFQPHTSHFTAAIESLFPIPLSLLPEDACFFANMETAVNLVQDGAPVLGERVLVLGQGIIGLLVSSLLSEFPLDGLVTADRYELRRGALNLEGSNVSKHTSLDPGAKDFLEQARDFLGDGADLTYEISGSPSALNDAIALTRFTGRIVIGSWYGQKRAEVDLGGAFHRSRLRLISSQVSTIAPELSARWNKARRFEVTWAALRRIRPEKWITHRFSIEQAGRAYELVNTNPGKTIQVIFDYRVNA